MSLYIFTVSKALLNFEYFIYIAALLLAYEFLNTDLCLIFYVSLILLYILLKPINCLYLPFLVHPLMFVVRARAVDNVALTLIPDASIIIGLLYMISRRGVNFKFSDFSIVIIIFCILSTLILIAHVGDLFLSFAIIRQHLIPLLFWGIFLNYSKTNKHIIIQCYDRFFRSVVLVVLMAILNTYNIISITPNFPEVYPYVNYDLSSNESIVGRSLLDNIIVPRLNLLLGGGFGSSSAIVLALVIANLSSTSYRILLYPLMVFASIATLSFSALIPIFSNTIIYFISSKKKYFLIIPLPIAIYYLFNFKLAMDLSPYEYFSEFVLYDFLNYLNNLSLLDFIFGQGPRITAVGFNYLPEVFLVDVGIFRVFLESGIVSFLIFIYILIIIAIRGFVSVRQKNAQTKKFLLIFLTIIFLIHGNYTIIPPFYLLFVLSSSYILNFWND